MLADIECTKKIEIIQADGLYLVKIKSPKPGETYGHEEAETLRAFSSLSELLPFVGNTIPEPTMDGFAPKKPEA
jgi:hypothetical protein